MNKNIKAFLIGSIVIATISSLSLWAMFTFEKGYIGWLSMFSPFIGAFITSLLAKSRKVLLSILLAVPSAIIFGIENYAMQLLGKGSDFPGYEGFLIVVGLGLINAIVLCSIGGLVGRLVARFRLNPVQ